MNAAGADVTATIGSTPLVTITGYSTTVYAESGINAGSSSASRSGSLSYWNGTGFTTVPVSSAGTATFTVPQVTGTYGTAVIKVSGTVTASAPAMPGTGTSPCVSAACGVKATGGSLVAQLTYVILSGGTQVGGFTVTLDLGSALAQTTYKGAPSA